MEPMQVQVPLPKESDPELGEPITTLWIRPGTLDEAVIKEIFQDDVYHLRSLQLRPTPHTDIDGNEPFVARIVDLGACFGAFTALACQMFPDARIDAVEPNIENFNLLRQNTMPWAHRVSYYSLAVGAENDIVTLVGGGADGHTVSKYRDPDSTDAAEQRTLEQVISDVPIALLKVDIEGAEWAMFDAVPVESLALVDRIAMEWHGPEMCPWAFGERGNVHYGDLLHKLAFTHAVNVYGDPDRGGMLFAHRYD